MTSLVRLTPVTARVRAASFGYTALRTTSLSLPSRATAKTRYISTTTEKDGGVIDSTKGTLKKADRVVSDAAVKGIDKGGMLTLLSA